VRVEPKQRRKHSDGTPTVAIHVPDMVSLPDHFGFVDPAPINRDCAGRGFDPAGLVAGRRGRRRRGVRGDARLYRPPIGVLLLFGWSVTFFYHLCSGIRHLAWDAGYGFEIRDAYRSGYAVLAATVVLTVLAWLYVLLA
jgi:hypothetical protein